MALSIIAGGTFLVENSGPYERMHLFSAYYIIYTISTLSGNLIGGFMPDLLVGAISPDLSYASPYRLTLYISLAATILSILPLIFIEENGKGALEVAKRIQFDIYKSMVKSRTIRRMALVYSLCGIGWGVSLPYFNVYFDVALKASSSQIGLIFSISQLAMVMGYFLVPMLTEWIGKVRLASSVQILSIPFLLVFAFTSSITVAAFGYVMRNVLMNMANPIFNSFKLEIVSSEERSMMNSMTWMACYTFVGLGTYAGGIIMAGGHNIMPFLITGIFYGLMAITYYLYFWKIEKGNDQ
jgi:MFS family permease